MIPELFKSYPSVYAVSDRYIIIVPVNMNCVMWVNVCGRNYYDHSNGILRSLSLVHKIEISKKDLDTAAKYTLNWRIVKSRKPYYSDLGEIESVSFEFKPCTGEKINIYNIADAHCNVSGPVSAGSYYGDDLDLLIMNGDIPDHSGKIENFDVIYQISGSITKGRIPVIFSRGNHDLRGIYAEKIEDYTPTDLGRSYYTVRLGSIWAVVLDCAEDKADENPEYGNTTCCHEFRVEETEFLERVANDPLREYGADGVKYKLVIVHNPFSEKKHPPFDIEEDIFRKWCRILSEQIKPDLMLCGHMHKCYVSLPKGSRDAFGQPCPVVCSSQHSSKDPSWFRGGAITLCEDTAVVKFTDSNFVASDEIIIKLKQ